MAKMRDVHHASLFDIAMIGTPCRILSFIVPGLILIYRFVPL